MKSLVDMGYKVLAIDSDEYIVQEFSEMFTILSRQMQPMR